MNKTLRSLVSFVCALSLSLTSVFTAAAQTQQRFALAGTTWEISYQDARLGEVRGLAKFSDGQDVGGFYKDPRTGKEYAFSGVARLEIVDGKPVAKISILQKGPVVGPSPGGLTTKPGERITAKLGKSITSLTILESSPVTLDLDLNEKTAVLSGLWKSPDELAKPLRAGTQSLTQNGKRFAAGGETWVPSIARFRGIAELRDANRNVSDGQKAKEQTFKIELSGIGLPSYEKVTASTVDFKQFADTLSLDFVWPNDGMFGRSLELRVNATEVPGPGTYPLTINGVKGSWTLEYRDLRPKVRFMRQLRVDEFEAVSEIYVGEDIFVEVEFEEKYKVDALDFATYSATVLDSTDARSDVTLKKVGSGLFRSGPVACLDAQNETNRSVTAALTCEDKAQVSALVEGGAGYRHDVTNPVVKAPSPLWDEAMAAAQSCRTGSFDQTVKGVNVQKQVHAALILLRDEMRRSIDGTVETYNTLIGPDPDLRMEKLESDVALYKASLKSGENDGALIQDVSLPNASNSDDKISLRDALNANYQPKLSDEARADYERIAASEAQGLMLAAAERTKKRLSELNDCDLAGLLQFGKLGAGAFNEKLKKKLLRRGLPGEADWMPDLAARAAVDSVAGVVAAVKAEADYRQAQVDFALTMVSLATAGIAITATLSSKLAVAGTRVAGRSIGKAYSKATLARLAAAGELAELAELGSAFTKVVDAQTRGQDAVERARDLAPVVGSDAFDQAQADKDAQIKGAAIAAAASAAGTGLLGRAGKKSPKNKRMSLAEAAGAPPSPPPSSTRAAAEASLSPASTTARAVADDTAVARPSATAAASPTTKPAADIPPTRTALADEPPSAGLSQNVDSPPSRPRDPDATVKVNPDKTLAIPRNMRGEGVSTGAPRDPDATVKVDPDKTLAIPRNMRGEGVSTGAPRDPDATVKVNPDKTLAIPRNMRGEGVSTGAPLTASKPQPRTPKPKTAESGSSAKSKPNQLSTGSNSRAIAKMDSSTPPTVKVGAGDDAAPPASSVSGAGQQISPAPKADPSEMARAPRAAEPNSPGADPPARGPSNTPQPAGIDRTVVVKPGQARGRPDAANNTIQAADSDYTLGERLGSGGSADVYRNATDATDKTALRVIHSKLPSTIPSERIGRQRLEQIAAQNNGELFNVVEQIQPPRLIDDSSAPMLLKGRQVEVVERIDNIASDVLKQNRPPYTGTMTPGQAAAHKATTDYLNDNGVAWIDNSPDNYGLVEVPPGSDKWKMRIVDTGGVVKFRGEDAAELARALQRDIANPPEEFLVLVAEAKAVNANKIAYSARKQRLNDLAQKYDDYVDFTGTGTSTIGLIGGKPAMSVNFPALRQTATPGPVTPFEFEGLELNASPTGTIKTRP